MIIDRIENIRKYEPLLNKLPEGLAAVDALQEKTVGRYEFDGGFFMIQEGDTRPIAEGDFEYHRNYLDVQMILEGCEELGWEEMGRLTDKIPYDPAKDIGFSTGEDEHIITIGSGMFYIVFPWDGHKPCIHTKQQHHYKKVVMKLPVR